MPVIVFPIANPVLKLEDWNTIFAEALTVLIFTEAEALLDWPNIIFFVREKVPVGVIDIEFVVEKVIVFAVVSFTTNVSLNSPNSSSAPFRIILSPALTPWAGDVIVTTSPILTGLVSIENVLDTENPKLKSVFPAVLNVFPLSVKVTWVFDTREEKIFAVVDVSVKVSPSVNVPFTLPTSRTTEDVFVYDLTVAVSPSKSVIVSSAVKTPVAFVRRIVTKVFPSYLFSAKSKSPPALPPDVFATVKKSCRTSEFADGSVGVPE